jgi:WD40 repeat protein
MQTTRRRSLLLLAATGGLGLALGLRAFPVAAQSVYRRAVDKAEAVSKTKGQQTREGVEAAAEGKKGGVDDQAELAPGFNIRSLAGQAYNLRQFRGQRVMLIFLDPGNPESNAEGDHLARLSGSLQQAGMTILPIISGDRGDASVTANDFVARRGGTFPYPLLLDDGSALFAAYRIRRSPTHIGIDPSGRIRLRQEGYQPDQFEAMLRGFAAGMYGGGPARKPLGYAEVLQGHTAPVMSIAWSPAGARLASASDDSLIRVWDPKSGQNTLLLQGHTDWVNSVAWSPNGRWIASGSVDGTVRLWDAGKGRQLKVLWEKPSPESASAQTDMDDPNMPPPGLPSVEKVAWHPGGTLVASAHWDGTIRLWNATTRKLRDSLAVHTRPTAIAWSPDGKTLAVGGIDGGLHLWDMRSNQWRDLWGHRDWVQAVAWRRDGRLIASAADDQTLRIWNVATGKIVRAWDVTTGRLTRVAESATPFSPSAAAGPISPRELADTQPPAWVHSLSWSPNGKYLATGGWRGVIRVLNTYTGKQQKVIRAHGDKVHAVAWSPDYTLLGSSGADGAVRLWRPLPEMTPIKITVVEKPKPKAEKKPGEEPEKPKMPEKPTIPKRKPGDSPFR